MAGSRTSKSRKLTPNGCWVASRILRNSFGICSAWVRPKPNIPRPPALQNSRREGHRRIAASHASERDGMPNPQEVTNRSVNHGQDLCLYVCYYSTPGG